MNGVRIVRMRAKLILEVMAVRKTRAIKNGIWRMNPDVDKVWMTFWMNSKIGVVIDEMQHATSLGVFTLFESFGPP